MEKHLWNTGKGTILLVKGPFLLAEDGPFWTVAVAQASPMEGKLAHEMSSVVVRKA